MNIFQAVATYQKTKGTIYAGIGLLLAGAVHFFPFLVSYVLIFKEGRILFGLAFPLIFWLVVSLYMGFLPIIWIVGIFKIGFVESTLGCLLFAAVFASPDVFFSLAEKQNRKALEAGEGSTSWE